MSTPPLGQTWQIRIKGGPLTLASVRQETEDQVRLRLVVAHHKRDAGAWYPKADIEWVAFERDDGVPEEQQEIPPKPDHAMAAAGDDSWKTEPQF